jgi:TatD DNase family protein
LQRENETKEYDNSGHHSPILTLTCSVAPSDWRDCLQYAAQSPHRRAAIGVHPWYIDELLTNKDGDNQQLDPTWYADMETLLQEHPGCLVGEIGLCQKARFVRTFPGGKTQALQLQRQVFQQQLQLAVQYQRPASIHCVQQQGILLDVFRQLFSSPSVLPPALALHSFSGTAHHIQQLLQWEQSLRRRDAPLLYFGFSHVVNVAMCTSEKSQRQTRRAILEVPYDRLLAESDVACDAAIPAGTAGAVAYLAFVLQRPLQEVAEQTRNNGVRFLTTLSGEHSEGKE